MSMATKGRGELEGTKAKTREGLSQTRPSYPGSFCGQQSRLSAEGIYEIKNRHPLREAVSAFAASTGLLTTPATTKRVMFWVSEIAAIL
jgi:hypothetical protein